MDAETKLAALTNLMDDQEAQSHRDNARIFSVKERIEVHIVFQNLVSQTS